ncbi:uncharacterized protein LOC143026773 [Oratosquilla oratoria]|uniref:uncharacterized protein LOC143026773 n=1 Tax=Oratosquilla oratoria TaxID=337810 RepID=UPI003F7719A6
MQMIVGNHCGISLLSITGKVLAGIINNRLKVIADQILPETQCGFRPERGTIDMIFSVWQLQEKCYEQHQPLYLAFIDLTKAFDCVCRQLLWKILKKVGCPDKFITIVQLFHDEISASVLANGGNSKPFKVDFGVKKGCVLAPTLFSIFVAAILHMIKNNVPPGTHILYRMDGKVFNLSRLKAKTKVKTTSHLDFEYTDDNSVALSSEKGLQQLLEASMSTSSKPRSYPSLHPISPTTHHPQYHSKEKFSRLWIIFLILEAMPHLMSTLTLRSNDLSVLGQHSANSALVSSKIVIFGKKPKYLCTTVLYGSETWTTYRRHIKNLERFHQSCLRSILKISWEDYKNKLSVLSEAKVPSGGQRKRYKDPLKTNLKNCDIDWNNWEQLAKDRDSWRHLTYQGAQIFKTDKTNNINRERQNQKERQRNRENQRLPPSTSVADNAHQARTQNYSWQNSLQTAATDTAADTPSGPHFLCTAKRKGCWLREPFT